MNGQKVKTYGELLQALLKANEEQLSQDISVCDATEEFYPIVFTIKEMDEDDVLDKGHLFLETEATIQV